MAAAGLAAEFLPVHLVVAATGILGNLCLGTLCLGAVLLGVRATEVRDGADRHVTSG
ncbi:hypothetical protein ACIPPS_01500 [Streptomyces sp. NPDC090127]|uniref:hypothetical protein n=1 Tax=Streptomyces sp. NPDC090127 TaxID=3365953 RepID=UPI0038074678